MLSTELKLQGTDEYFTQEAFNVLRTNIQFCGQDIKVIEITSCTMSEGKSYVTLNLGKSLAEIGKRVVIMDADMRKSVIVGRYTNLRKAKGLSELITGQAKVSDCIYKTQYPNLDIIFAGQFPPNPVELLETKHFSSILTVFQQSYDYVLIDTPPLGMVIDAAVIGAKCDGAIFVVGSNSSRYPQAQDVLSQLRKAGCKVLGAVLNNTEKKGSGYYYQKRGYGYYRKYYRKY